MILSGPRFRTHRRGLRVVGVLLLLATLGFVITTILVARHYKRLLRQQLPVAVAEATDGLYHVSLEDVDVNLFTRHLTLEGIHLWPDSLKLKQLQSNGQQPAYIADVFLPELQIQGGSSSKKTDGRFITLGRLWIGSPQVRLTLLDRDSVKAAKSIQRVPNLSFLFIRSIAIEDPQLTLKWKRGIRHWAGGFHGGSINIANVGYKPGAMADTLKYFGAESVAASLDSIYWKQQDGWYKVHTANLAFATSTKTLVMHDLAVEPSMSYDSLYKEAGSQMDIYKCLMPSLRIEGLDWKRLIYAFELSAARMKIASPDLSVFFSRVPPPNNESRSGRFPQQLLMKLPIPVDIPVTDISEGKVTYTELNNKTMVPAHIMFSSMTGYIANLTNHPSPHPDSLWCSVSLQGKFQLRSDILARIRFHLTDPRAGFTVECRLGPTEAAQVSEQASALALAGIRKMHLHRLDMLIRGNEIYSRGRITMLYDGIRVNVQKVDSDLILHPRPFVSLLANKLLLQPSNPLPGQPVRVAHTFVRRDETKSFFHLIWRNLYEAAVQTAFRDEGMKEVIENTKERKAYKKRYGKKRFFKNLFPKRDRRAK